MWLSGPPVYCVPFTLDGKWSVDSFKNVDFPDEDGDENLLSLRIKSNEELVGTQNLPLTTK